MTDRYAVPHPEVDETLYVCEAVVRVACPQCKTKAGVPCKGARFEWMAARGERRGFRYVQSSHVARRSMFQDWKRNGRPAHLPEGILETYATIHGPFPKKVDRKAEPAKVMPVLTGRPKKKKVKAAKESRWRPGQPLPELRHIERPKGVIWEAYVDNQLWHWTPYKEVGDFRSISVYDGRPEFDLSVRFMGHEHRCDSLEEAFDIGFQLVVEQGFLRVLTARAHWRVRELETRFGDRLKPKPSVVPLRGGNDV